MQVADEGGIVKSKTIESTIHLLSKQLLDPLHDAVLFRVVGVVL
jgi:hypothetical protein